MRDDVAALRNYHLMSLGAPRAEFAREDPLVSVPPEIASMADILRKKITDPKRIETNCARINRASGTDDKEASRLFQRVVQYWAEDNITLAVEAAEHASRKIPKNPDVWCLLGRAYLKGVDADAQKADAALRKAAELKSQRPELLPLRLEAKSLLGDWIGIVQLLETKAERSATDTLSLARANRALGEDQAQAGSWATAESYFLRGATAIRDAFLGNRAHGYVEPLMQLKFELIVAYVNAISHRVERGDDKIDLWEGAGTAWRFSVFHRGIMTLGINAALELTRAVERRDRADSATLYRIKSVVQALRILSSELDMRGSGWDLIASLAGRAVDQINVSAIACEARLG